MRAKRLSCGLPRMSAQWLAVLQLLPAGLEEVHPESSLGLGIRGRPFSPGEALVGQGARMPARRDMAGIRSLELVWLGSVTKTETHDR